MYIEQGPRRAEPLVVMGTTGCDGDKHKKAWIQWQQKKHKPHLTTVHNHWFWSAFLTFLRSNYGRRLITLLNTFIHFNSLLIYRYNSLSLHWLPIYRLFSWIVLHFSLVQLINSRACNWWWLWRLGGKYQYRLYNRIPNTSIAQYCSISFSS